MAPHPVASAAAVLAAVALACGSGAPDAGATSGRPPTPVVVETLVAEAFAPTLRVPGIVLAESRAALGFRVGGRVAAFTAEEGDRVEEGAAIAALDLVDLERAVKSARADLARASAAEALAALAFERHRRLFELASTSRKSFDAARLEREMLEAEARSAALALEAAEGRLADGTLRAPFAGYVERHLVEVHEHASAETPVVILSALDTAIVRAAVPDAFGPRLRPGDAALVRAAAWPARVFRGRVRRVDVSADPATRAFPFEVQLGNQELLLRPEMAVWVELPIGEPQDAPAVPLASVLRGASGEPFCFAVEGDVAPDGTARARRRPVALGPVQGERVRIASGLAQGDRVVTRGQHFVADGERVRVVAHEP